ncbi:carboxypeptidase B [Eurytemora carolleeae]|uniref:carboxypeptidase B n=1 Tax=Eurytemora carolleeae TaxID=1294199 RepID=UPI000C7665B0|nr:carboxypeptidase B [Eurytemora carolleeae]|eukprot:XP_023343768.1 carboxypeptidase B-like [Eurytemora affinis]
MGLFPQVGSRTAEVLENKYGSIYEVGSAAKLLYPASGGSDDFAKGGAGIKYSFTVELPDTGKHAFILPARLIKNVGNEAVTCLDTMLSNI